MKCTDVRYHQEETSKHWRWTRHDENGDVVGKSSEGYVNEQDCIDNAERTQAADDTFTAFTDGDGRHRWIVKAHNGKIVAAAHKGFYTPGGAELNAKQNGYENKFKRM